MRKLFGAIMILAAAAGMYLYYQHRVSDPVRQELMRIADDMDLAPVWTADLKDMIERFHEEAFRRALDVSQELGRKFDAKAYYEEIFRRIIDYAQEQGKPEFAARLAEEKEFHSLRVTER
jgi:hypothetical protein